MGEYSFIIKAYFPILPRLTILQTNANTTYSHQPLTLKFRQNSVRSRLLRRQYSLLKEKIFEAHKTQTKFDENIAFWVSNSSVNRKSPLGARASAGNVPTTAAFIGNDILIWN